MAYRSLEECLLFLEKKGQLIRITGEVDPNLEMAAIHLRVHAAGGPALLFEKVKGSPYRAASNIFGTLERSRLIFGDSLEKIRSLIRLKADPLQALRHPMANLSAAGAALHALPKKDPASKPVLYKKISITDLPLIKHWPDDGGAFVTLPQVYTEDADKPGIMHANLGMYRIQLTGNDYVLNQEIGLHYQLHRGIGVHQAKANALGKPLKVSIFVGGPPSHSVAAVMPLPEGISEMTFAGVLGNRRFRYTYHDGYCISTDADFVITGEVRPNELKPEGPFGDHLGYYSLAHPFPVLHVHEVWAKKDAIWPFTVVGRPPQEDTSFGQLIHEMTGDALQQEIPGLKEVHAVDAAGVHPLLLATGSERYTPYAQTRQPAEILTIANRILGTGQLSLAKFVWITAGEEVPPTHSIAEFLTYILERIHLERDIHFYTNTTIDTLDYSGEGLNTGSKMVIAAYGQKIRALDSTIPACLQAVKEFSDPALVMPGILVLKAKRFTTQAVAREEMEALNKQLLPHETALSGIPLIIIADEPAFVAATLGNFLWVTFTRCNPSHDVYGIGEFIRHKHWGCTGPMIIDARIKPHHAPPLHTDPATEERIAHLFSKGAVLEGY